MFNCVQLRSIVFNCVKLRSVVFNCVQFRTSDITHANRQLQKAVSGAKIPAWEVGLLGARTPLAGKALVIFWPGGGAAPPELFYRGVGR